MARNPQDPCPDCGVAPGELHVLGCDVEHCPYCGGQLLVCEHALMHGAEGPPPDDDRLPWTGKWPGAAECREFGWYAKRVEGGWAPCRPDEPGAQPDLNRLDKEAAWDRERKRFVRK